MKRYWASVMFGLSAICLRFRVFRAFGKVGSMIKVKIGGSWVLDSRKGRLKTNKNKSKIK